MFLHKIDLTTALRPALLADEAVLFVQNGVGLYEGKLKIASYQNGHAYLTTHRACYVDNADPRKHCVAVDLKDVDHVEFYAGFLKSSAKVTLVPKTTRQGAARGQSPLSQPGSSRPDSPSINEPPPPPRPIATWICPICSFSNPIPPNFDPATANSRTYISPCKNCGIKPPLLHVTKAALSANRQSASVSTSSPEPQQRAPPSSGRIRCPRCTFANHPSLPECEMCGSPLNAAPDPRLDVTPIFHRAESPGPSLLELSLNDNVDNIKFSFREGGEKAFHERIEKALLQRKWLLQGAPPIPRPAGSGSDSERSGSPGGRKLVGIAGLELRGQELRKNNEVIIGNAFEDLEALMTSAKEIIALAESFSSQAQDSNGLSAEADSLLSQSATTLGLATTKDMLGSDALYISELSRNLAEFLTDDARGILRKEGGVMTLVDLWAMFNRIRNGVELISPSDFEQAAQMWDKLKLPVRLRQFKSGLLVVQGRDRTDDKTVASILAWLKELHSDPLTTEVTWDWQKYGFGVSAQDAARKFGWSVGVATEELEMAEEKGTLCREQGLDGIRFWENWFFELPPED